MKKQKEQYTRTLTLTATELSLLHQGIKALIREQKEAIASQPEPYRATLKNHLKRLEELESMFANINEEIEDQVLTEIQKEQKQ